VAQVQLPVEPISHPATRARRADRERLIRRARGLAWIGLAWHVLETAIAIAAGLLAGSIALVGFGADSLVEALAGLVVLWRFAAARSASDAAERRAQQLIAISFYAVAAYVGVEALRSLATADEPDASWIGIALAAFTLATMPPLASAKARVADALGSSATKSESRQTTLCAYLSAALLVGLGANAVLGWWWADPLTALVIAAVAVQEGRKSWAGESCCTGPVGLDSAISGDSCCN